MSQTPTTRLALATVALTLVAGGAFATPPPSADAECVTAIRAAERVTRLPAQLLMTIATVESGRRHPTTNRVTPWPWAINVAGVGYYFESKFEAVQAVEKFRAQGVRSIDVGCMQINLMHHPAAFASLADAFEPQTNVAYGSRFLSSLFQQFGTWPQAVGAYHSQTPERMVGYMTRVYAQWPGSSRYTAGMPVITTAAARVAPNPNHLPALTQMLRQVEEDRRALTGTARPASQLAGTAALPGRRDNRRFANLGDALRR